MIGGFRAKGLEEIYRTGKTRRIGADHIRKCVRILRLLEVAGKPGGHEYRGLSLPPAARDPKTLVTFGWSGENALEVDFEDYH
jgi:plasmid maintenance system killer protein